MSAAWTRSYSAGQSSAAAPCSRMSGQTPGARSWSTARTTSTSTPFRSMIAVEIRMSPSVLRELRRGLERAVDVERLQIGEVPAARRAELLLEVGQASCLRSCLGDSRTLARVEAAAARLVRRRTGATCRGATRATRTRSSSARSCSSRRRSSASCRATSPGSSGGRPSSRSRRRRPRDVIREWQGLGYNRRGLNLHRAARQIATRRLARRSHRAAGRRSVHGRGPPPLRAWARTCFRST